MVRPLALLAAGAVVLLCAVRASEDKERMHVQSSSVTESDLQHTSAALESKISEGDEGKSSSLVEDTLAEEEELDDDETLRLAMAMSMEGQSMEQVGRPSSVSAQPNPAAVPVRAHAPSGIVNNMRKLCFINSMLQALFYAQPFRDMVFRYAARGLPQFEVLNALASVFARLSMDRTGRGAVELAAELIDVILRYCNSDFRVFRNGDPHAFFTWLVVTLPTFVPSADAAVNAANNRVKFAMVDDLSSLFDLHMVEQSFLHGVSVSDPVEYRLPGYIARVLQDPTRPIDEMLTGTTSRIEETETIRHTTPVIAEGVLPRLIVIQADKFFYDATGPRHDTDSPAFYRRNFVLGGRFEYRLVSRVDYFRVKHYVALACTDRAADTWHLFDDSAVTRHAPPGDVLPSVHHERKHAAREGKPDPYIFVYELARILPAMGASIGESKTDTLNEPREDAQVVDLGFAAGSAGRPTWDEVPEVVQELALLNDARHSSPAQSVDSVDVRSPDEIRGQVHAEFQYVLQTVSDLTKFLDAHVAMLERVVEAAEQAEADLQAALDSGDSAAIAKLERRVAARQADFVELQAEIEEMRATLVNQLRMYAMFGRALLRVFGHVQPATVGYTLAQALAEYDAYRKREKEAAHMRHAYNAAYGMHVEATPRMREEAVRAERARWAERRAALMRAMDAHDFVTLLAAEMNGRRVLHSETIAALLATHPEIMAGMVLPALDGSQSRMSSLVLGSSRETTGRGSMSTDHVGLSLSPGPGSFEDRK